MTDTQKDRYLIRKRGAFYRPNAEGYTMNRAEAGRYTLAQAIWHSHPTGPDGPRDGIDYMLADPLAGVGKPIAGIAEPFLDQLRRVNLARYEAWVEGADAGIMFDALELGGEVGELLNVVKKLEREERGWRGSRAAPEDFADECADVLICLDKLARRRDVDLAAVTISKFNATSEKVGLPHRLEASLGSGAPAEQEVSVSVAECVEPRPVGDPKIVQVEDCTGPQREAEGVPRDHAGAHTKGPQSREVFLAQAVTNILPIGDNRAPCDRVIPIYVRMDELRALHALATSRSQHEGADNG